MDNGILIKNNGVDTFDSRKSHLLVPGGKNPPYLGVTTIAAPALMSPGVEVSQVVLTIKHGLKYAPFIDTYFYPTSAQPADPNQYFQVTDSYYKNFFSYIALGGAGVYDLLKVKVDDVQLTVTHIYFNFAGGTDSPFSVNMKYTIFANEGYLQP